MYSASHNSSYWRILLLTWSYCFHYSGQSKHPPDVYAWDVTLTRIHLHVPAHTHTDTQTQRLSERKRATRTVKPSSPGFAYFTQLVKTPGLVFTWCAPVGHSHGWNTKILQRQLVNNQGHSLSLLRVSNHHPPHGRKQVSIVPTPRCLDPATGEGTPGTAGGLVSSAPTWRWWVILMSPLAKA